MGKNYTNLQKRLGYHFQDLNLLAQALRHASVGGMDNQRLEFLGDRVLGLVIADILYTQDPAAQEGDLAPRFNYLVRKESCANVATNLDLGQEIHLGRSEAASGGRHKKALLGDVIESLIAAIYLDGGFAPAQNFVYRNWAPLFNQIPKNVVDSKTQLQEFLQKQGEPLPVYTLISRTGPDHEPVFEIEVQTKQAQAKGRGKTKREAEQNAAQMLLDHFS